MNLNKQTKITRVISVTEGAAGATNINSTEIDMEGFESVLFIVTFGAIVAGAATSIKAQQDTVTGMGGAADLLGTAQTVADTDDEKIFYIDLVKPRERFVRLVVLRATQNATCHAHAIQYNPRKWPTTHGSNVSGETHVSPAEGTA